jgi:5-methyltetrahydrofolate--homocysteine methyltransferase
MAPLLKREKHEMSLDFLSQLTLKPLMFDGATGTMLQRLGLKPGGCPDELILKDPAMVSKVHSAYIEAAPSSRSTGSVARPGR